MQATLQPLSSNSSRRCLTFTQFPVVLGRSPDVDVPLEDRWASRRHCEIVQDADQLIVRDLGSKHGTYVNEQRITQAALKSGDRLGIGLSIFQVVYRLQEQLSAR